GQLRIQIAVQRIDRVGREQVVVAVGRRLGHVLRGDDLVRAGLVLDHDLLAPGVGQLLPQRAHQQVRRSAGGIGHDDADGFGWISLRKNNRRYACYEKQNLLHVASEKSTSFDLYSERGRDCGGTMRTSAPNMSVLRISFAIGSPSAASPSTTTGSGGSCFT